MSYAPALPAIIASLSARITAHGGAMLIIDYGKADAFGDTVQAVYQHKPVDILTRPGETDLTAWVDFSHISAVAISNGLTATPLQPQGSFLNHRHHGTSRTTGGKRHPNCAAGFWLNWCLSIHHKWGRLLR